MLRGGALAVIAGLVTMLAACGGGGAAPTAPPATSNPTPTPAPTPPFTGTIVLDADIITAADPTTFQGLTDGGQANRQMFDRRANAFITVNAHLFNARFSDGLTTEVQVNPEFGGTDAARVVANAYAAVIGRLPKVLRVSVATVWIHQGVEGFGGGNNNLLIHTGQGDRYLADGILEETFMHEAVHTSLDAQHASSAGWVSAQTRDAAFISTYVRDFPQREDLAETYLLYFAIRYRSDRISQALGDTVRATVPNRIAYLDALGPVVLPGQ